MSQACIYSKSANYYKKTAYTLPRIYVIMKKNRKELFMNRLINFITDSQTKIFHDSPIMENLTGATVLANEPYSFTYAYKLDEGDFLPISVSATCEGLSLSVYKVIPVALTHSAYKHKVTWLTPLDKKSLETFETATEERGIGLYPEVMLPRSASPKILSTTDPQLPFFEEQEQNRLEAHDEGFASLIITANEEHATLPAGEYDIKITATSLGNGEILSENHFTLKVISAELPKISFKYTNWFHYDCVADIHGVELYSEKYFEILKSYFKNAADYGMNMLLIPAITPPLDTPIGMYRKNVQLTDITLSDGKYSFDFTRLERLIRLATECGIEYFEHPHLFTQWGAKHAPAIYATVDGEQRRIFGWDTDAIADGYRGFLESYIPAFRAFTEKIGISDKTFYHISDEPTHREIESYSKAVEIVKPLLTGAECGDALSHIEFYEQGLVGVPIVCIDNAPDFFGKCENFWTYYTGGYYKDHSSEYCSNRIITSKPYKTRILGLHSFAYKAGGFLHWGLNFYYGRMSNGLYNPLIEPCGYVQRQGASYLVYPGLNCALPCLRELYMREAMCDLRALKLLESLTNYDYVMEVARKYFGEDITCFTMANSAESMRGFRELINREIERRI